MDYSTLDDSTLLQLIAHAKTDALGELYNRYFRQIFGLALAILKDPALAEEITQDVFLRVWTHAKTYHKDQAKVSVWMTRIARNRAIDAIRGRKAHPEHQAVALEHSPALERAIQDTPQTALELALQQERIQAAVAQLPDDQHHVITLMYFQGYTQQEIADLLKTPLGTIKTRARLAMLKLRALLQDDSVMKSETA